jgi:S-methylmethionine-dependent homocysteine/selenocysteine methylase
MPHNLPQLDGRVFLTEAGLETDLIFHHDIDLPHFASFPLLDTEGGRKVLFDYYQSFIDIARRDGTGVVFETPTWRANPDWGTQLGYSAEQLDHVNRQAVDLLRSLSAKNPGTTVVKSGCLGPRGDGYIVGEAMSANEAASYHSAQINSFAAAGADMVSALTLSYVDEAIGISAAAQEAGIPVAISFTVETDGVLPSGQGLADAVNQVDQATGEAPAYYMVNCAHPAHFADVLTTDGPWHRIRAVRANASRMSHDELDNATELDRGDEAELASGYLALHEALPNLAVVGGCCGTDIRHIDAISAAFTKSS